MFGFLLLFEFEKLSKYELKKIRISIMKRKKIKKINRLELADLLKGKTKFQIYTYLEMYGELSLTKIAKKLNKSKSTIYEHLKILHEINI